MGDKRGLGPWEKSGWQEYRRRERKGQEVGDLKGWEAEEKMGNYANIRALYFTIK